MNVILISWERKLYKTKLKTLNQSLRKFERDLLRFSHYGEVKAILPKTAESSGKQLKDYEFVREIGGRLGNVKLYRNPKDELVVLKKFWTDTKHSGALNRELSMFDFKHPLILHPNQLWLRAESKHLQFDRGFNNAWWNNDVHESWTFWSWS